MGDNRAIALDSRSFGPLATSDIVGRVLQVPAAGGSTQLRTPETFFADGLAPTDHRHPDLSLLLGLATLALVAVIVQGTIGTIRWAARRRRRKRRQQQLHDGGRAYA